MRFPLPDLRARLFTPGRGEGFVLKETPTLTVATILAKFPIVATPAWSMNLLIPNSGWKGGNKHIETEIKRRHCPLPLAGFEEN
ncbi:MAG: hypothetical protein U0941_11680 [Planctomycetaceae bacterium]